MPLPDEYTRPDILPCPFCGCEEINVVDGEDKTASWVACVNCDAMVTGEQYNDVEDAVKAWNRRVPDVRRLERIEKAADELADAAEQAREWIEGDECTHGRKFGTGNAIRAALATFRKACKLKPCPNCGGKDK